MPSPAVTHTFTNSTTADATQVNTNFTDLINSLTDGTKDLSISALTAGGAATLNGAVTLGSASNDDLTVNASLASSIPIKTTNSYDIGTNAIGLRSVYFSDAGGNARATRLIGGTVAAAVTLTGPTRTGTIELVPTVTAAQTATYAVLTTDDFIQLDASGGAFTSTLPTAVGATGKIYRFKRTDNTPSISATIATTSSQTIDGVTTTTLNTQYEMLEVMSDGANWQILRRHIPSVWAAITQTGSFTTNTTYTTYARREGDSLHVRTRLAFAGAPDAGNCTLTIPLSLTIDTAKFYDTIGGSVSQVGGGFIKDNGGSAYAIRLMLNSTTQLIATYEDDAASGVIVNSLLTHNSTVVLGNTDGIDFEYFVPIVGWKG